MALRGTNEAFFFFTQVRGLLVKAISLIVTHRTDDQSELPKTGVSAPSKPRKAAAVKRFNLRLPGAPEPLAPQVPLVSHEYPHLWFLEQSHIC